MVPNPKNKSSSHLVPMLMKPPSPTRNNYTVNIHWKLRCIIKTKRTNRQSEKPPFSSKGKNQKKVEKLNKILCLIFNLFLYLRFLLPLPLHCSRDYSEWDWDRKENKNHMIYRRKSLWPSTLKSLISIWAGRCDYIDLKNQLKNPSILLL